MRFFSWILRCAPGLSLLLLIIFLELTLGILRSVFLPGRPKYTLLQSGNTVLQALFICYSLILHITAFLFPLRLCKSAWSAARSVHEAHRDDALCVADGHTGYRAGSPVSDVQDEKAVIMAITIPIYKEDMEVLEDTLKVLASHKMAAASYDIYLAMEERDPKALQTAASLLKTFDGRFSRMQYTMHPAGIEGEAPGKSSNISWAAKEIEKVYSGTPMWKDVLITIMDSDSHLLGSYFELIQASHMHSRAVNDAVDMTLYMPPIIFDRNSHRVPRLVRTADMMWCGAGLSCFQSLPTTSRIAIPTAVYTIPLPLAHLVGGWDTGPGAIGEDMHMMLKCYFATNGQMTIESIPSPASQCNVTTGRNGVRGWFADHNARYQQGLRHMWGCLDAGFTISRWLALGGRIKPSQSVSHDSHGRLRGRLSPQSRKLSHTDLQVKLSQHALHGSTARRITWRNAELFVRIFEAHFLPAHLFLILIASAAYSTLTPPAAEHYLILFCLNLTGWLRFFGFATMIFYFAVVYEHYHKVCLGARERDMIKADLYGELHDQFSYRTRIAPSSWFDWLIFPVAGTAFGSLPLIQAAISHLWTDKLVYLVSAKPKKLGTSIIGNESSPREAMLVVEDV